MGVGDAFEVRRGDHADSFWREPDDPAPAFPCERIRVTHLTCSVSPGMSPYTFGAEPEWFRQRGLKLKEET